MKNWRKIKNAIYDALDGYDCDVTYNKRTSDCCSYFSIEIKEEYSWDDVCYELGDVIDEYALAIDGDSVEDLNLNVYWDTLD